MYAWVCERDAVSYPKALGISVYLSSRHRWQIASNLLAEMVQALLVCCYGAWVKRCIGTLV